MSFVAELLLNPTPLFAFIVLFGEGVVPILAPIGIASKTAMDGCVLARLRGRWKWTPLLFVPFKDLAVSMIWMIAAVRRTVVWRGQRYRVLAMSRLAPHVEAEPVSGLDSTAY